MDGWIKLHRIIQNNWIWENSDYLKRWLDLLLLANHKPKKIPFNNEFKIIDIGEYHTSETKLARRWFIDRKTVNSFLKLLEKDNMISIKRSRQDGTTIKVLNYLAYQSISNDSLDNESDNETPSTGTSKPHRLDINKNVKNEKKERIKDMSKDISLDGLRQRYTPEQLKIIDDFFGVLKHTRRSAKIENSVILKIYQSWSKHEVTKVIYALRKYIHSPSLHDKKENYVLGMIRNTTMAEIEKYRNQINSEKSVYVYGGTTGGDEDGDSL